MQSTDLTVCAVVESDGRFLLVEETVGGTRVLTQPGGHIERDETPEEAVRREVFEEAACDVDVGELIGVYLWTRPQARRQYLRIVYVADLVQAHRRGPAEPGIHRVHWMRRAEIERRRDNLRSPVVLRCLDDYRDGRRRPASLLADMQPVERHVDAVLASALLI